MSGLFILVLLPGARWLSNGRSYPRRKKGNMIKGKEEAVCRTGGTDSHLRDQDSQARVQSRCRERDQRNITLP